MKKTMFAVVAAVLLFLTACEKDKDQTTQSKIEGKWNVVRIIDKEAFVGLPVFIDTIAGTSADYFNFRTDGKREASYDGAIDTLTYKLQGDTAILFSGTNLFKIRTLTSTQLILHERQTFSSGDYTEETFELKR